MSLVQYQSFLSNWYCDDAHGDLYASKCKNVQHLSVQPIHVCNSQLATSDVHLIYPTSTSEIGLPISCITAPTTTARRHASARSDLMTGDSLASNSKLLAILIEYKMTSKCMTKKPALCAMMMIFRGREQMNEVCKIIKHRLNILIKF